MIPFIHLFTSRVCAGRGTIIRRAQRCFTSSALLKCPHSCGRSGLFVHTSRCSKLKSLWSMIEVWYTTVHGHASTTLLDTAWAQKLTGLDVPSRCSNADMFAFPPENCHVARKTSTCLPMSFHLSCIPH